METLQTIKQQLETYRQAVLKEAMSVYECPIAKISDVCSDIVDCPHSTPKWVESGYLCLRTTNFRRGFLDLTEPNYVSQDTFNSRNKRLVRKQEMFCIVAKGRYSELLALCQMELSPALVRE